MRRASPLAVDNFMKVVRLPKYQSFHSYLYPRGNERVRGRSFDFGGERSSRRFLLVFLHIMGLVNRSIQI